MADQAAFGFRNSISKEVTWLTFEIISTDLARRWALCVFRETRKCGLHVKPVGALYVDEPVVRAKISQLCANLLRRKPGLALDRAVPEIATAAFIEKRILHGLAETCRELLASPSESSAVRVIARELALWVRHYTTIYHTDVHFHLSLQRELPWLVALKSEDFNLFQADRIDGGLYLEYPTMGTASLAAYQAQDAVDIEPQQMFSSNCEIMYREDFEWGAKIEDIRRWVVDALGERGPELEKAGRLAIGMLPLGRPTHGLSRAEVREMALQSDLETLFLYKIDGEVVSARTIRKDSVENWRRLTKNRIASVWANRSQIKKISYQIVSIWGERWRIRLFFFNLVNQFYYKSVALILRLWGERWRIRLFFFNLVNQFYYRGLLQWYYGAIRLYHDAIQIYHNCRPVVVAWAHSLTWPIRKPYYFAKFQFNKRILRRR